MTKRTATATVATEQLLLAGPRVGQGGGRAEKQKAARPCTISQTQP